MKTSDMNNLGIEGKELMQQLGTKGERKNIGTQRKMSKLEQ
jgi:hypothetical protein